VKHISGAALKGRPLELPKNIRLGWKGLLETNTQAYYENPKITTVKVLQDWPPRIILFSRALLLFEMKHAIEKVK
jgi:hypothetical protein